jgi:hypothetical protein
VVSLFVYDLHYILTFYDSPETDVLAIQKFTRLHRNKKLARVSIFLSTISHAQHIRLIMLMVKILVLKKPTIDTVAPSAISCCDISGLDQIPRDNAMEEAPSVGQTLSKLAHSLFPSTQAPEIIAGFRDVTEKFKYNSSSRPAVY